MFFLPCHCFHSGGCYFAHLTEEETEGHSDPLPQVALSLTELSWDLLAGPRPVLSS